MERRQGTVEVHALGVGLLIKAHLSPATAQPISGWEELLRGPGGVRAQPRVQKTLDVRKKATWAAAARACSRPTRALHPHRDAFSPFMVHNCVRLAHLWVMCAFGYKEPYKARASAPRPSYACRFGQLADATDDRTGRLESVPLDGAHTGDPRTARSGPCSRCTDRNVYHCRCAPDFGCGGPQQLSAGASSPASLATPPAPLRERAPKAYT